MDLNLVETDQLLEELERRFDAIVFAGVQFRTDHDDFVRTQYHGSTMACTGLTQVVSHDLLELISTMRETLDT